MNRNVEAHFSELPTIDIDRSTFDRSAGHKTSFNVGQLIPFYVDEVLPGDTFKVSTSAVVRLQTLLTPVMDNIYMDTYYFFVPNRLTWEHWKEFCGENTTSPWYPSTQYTIPKLAPPLSTGWNVGTIADYMGIPVNTQLVANCFPSALPFRAYAMICDQWFRSTPLQDPLNISVGDALAYGTNGNSQINDISLGGYPFIAAKYHDYFTSALPSPQYGAGVTIFGSQVGVNPTTIDPSTSVPVYAGSGHGRTLNAITFQPSNTPGLNNYRMKPANTASGTLSAVSTTDVAGAFPINLWAEVGQLQLSINQLRMAFQMQKWQEKAARGGSRYHELLHEMFTVRPEDQRVQIPEYLGGHRFPLSIHQVANQTAGTNEFLGDLGAMSNTSDVHDDFIKSFTEHGYVIGVCVVRYDHSYPQGIEKFWFREDPMEFYWPVFANLGEQPVRKGELYCNGVNDYDVFGFQEYGAEYRYKPSRVSAEMRPGIANSLASWHLSDYYTTVPSLSDSWIREDKANVDRVLAVTSSVSNQVFCDFFVRNICTRAMPMYSIPGLIDHH